MTEVNEIRRETAAIQLELAEADLDGALEIARLAAQHLERARRAVQWARAAAREAQEAGHAERH